jgi:glycosyltransferase involved in cell wall biosynthesis
VVKGYRALKILMVISQFHPIVGGAERQAQLLAKKLIEKGIRVDLITGWWNFGTPRKEMIDGVSVVRNFCGWGMFGMNKHRTIRVLGGIIYVITLGAYLFLHGREYDIIHVHQFLYPAFVSLLIGKEVLKKPVIVKSASSGSTSDIERLRRLPLGFLQLNFLLKELDHLVAVSRATGEDFKQIGYSESRISYIPNGVEVPILLKPIYNQVRQIITITRLSQEKGLDILLKAWTEVIREEKSLKLLIVGSGYLEPELKTLSRSLGIAESVDFVGSVQNPPNFLKESDLFVLSSRSEGMSNALLEAMSYGIPCIATRVGGNSELLGGGDEEIPLESYGIGENGLLVNPDDVKGLSKAILYFIRDERAREEMGRRARNFIQENYSIDLVGEIYLSLYRSILTKKL